MSFAPPKDRPSNASPRPGWNGYTKKDSTQVRQTGSSTSAASTPRSSAQPSPAQAAPPRDRRPSRGDHGVQPIRDEVRAAAHATAQALLNGHAAVPRPGRPPAPGPRPATSNATPRTLASSGRTTPARQTSPRPKLASERAGSPRPKRANDRMASPRPGAASRPVPGGGRSPSPRPPRQEWSPARDRAVSPRPVFQTPPPKTSPPNTSDESPPSKPSPQNSWSAAKRALLAFMKIPSPAGPAVNLLDQETATTQTRKVWTRQEGGAAERFSYNSRRNLLGGGAGMGNGAAAPNAGVPRGLNMNPAAATASGAAGVVGSSAQGAPSRGATLENGRTSPRFASPRRQDPPRPAYVSPRGIHHPPPPLPERRGPLPNPPSRKPLYQTPSRPQSPGRGGTLGAPAAPSRPQSPGRPPFDAVRALRQQSPRPQTGMTPRAAAVAAATAGGTTHAAVLSARAATVQPDRRQPREAGGPPSTSSAARPAFSMYGRGGTRPRERPRAGSALPTSRGWGAGAKDAAPFGSHKHKRLESDRPEEDGDGLAHRISSFALELQQALESEVQRQALRSSPIKPAEASPGKVQKQLTRRWSASLKDFDIEWRPINLGDVEDQDLLNQPAEPVDLDFFAAADGSYALKAHPVQFEDRDVDLSLEDLGPIAGRAERELSERQRMYKSLVFSHAADDEPELESPTAEDLSSTEMDVNDPNRRSKSRQNGSAREATFTSELVAERLGALEKYLKG